MTISITGLKKAMEMQEELAEAMKQLEVTKKSTDKFFFVKVGTNYEVAVPRELVVMCIQDDINEMIKKLNKAGFKP